VTRETDIEHPRAIRRLLDGDDRRSIGRADEVVAEVLNHPERFATVMAAMKPLTERGSPAIRARGRRLLVALRAGDGPAPPRSRSQVDA